MAPKKKHRVIESDVMDLRAAIPFVSQTALAAVCKYAATKEMPEVTNRKKLRKCRDATVQTITPYGPLHSRLQITDEIHVEIQHPFAMLHYVCRHSESFSKMVGRALAEYPPTRRPWQLILYGDEVSPGNQLAYTHKRKTWAIYWSFVEFGPHLSQEDRRTPTHTPAIKRTRTSPMPTHQCIHACA